MKRIRNLFGISTLFLALCLTLVPAGLWAKVSAKSAPERGLLRVRDSSGAEVGAFSGSFALLIGAGDYRNGWPRLPGVKQDVADVQAALERQGFSVTVVTDPDRKGLESAIDDFINKRGRDENNRLLVYFAGHGHTIKKSYGGEMGYIVPVDAPNPEKDRSGFLSKAMDMQMIGVYAQRMESRHAMFVFDSCFSGSIFALSRAVPENISKKTAKPVRQFITSGGPDETVPDKSLFRGQFVSALDGEADVDGDGYITGTELGEFLQKTVTNYSHGSQNPQYGKIRDPNLDKGDFVFLAKAGGSVITETPKPADAPETVSLTVTTEPSGATVYVDGKRRGTAPVTIDGLSPGKVVVRAERDGCEPREETVHVRADRSSEVRLMLAAKAPPGGVLSVSSDPSGAAWYLDGAYAGTTPDEMKGVSPGEYMVTVKKEGYTDISRSVTVWAGRSAALDVTLERVAKQDDNMVFVKGGCFRMGDNFGDGESDEKPVHEVCVDDFHMGKHEVTVGEFRKFVDASGYRTDAEKDSDKGCYAMDAGKWDWRKGLDWRNPGFVQGDDHPVVCVSWNDAQAFVKWLGVKNGKKYRLPTEAEWEYSALGGTTGKRFWGSDSEACKYANVADNTKSPDGYSFTNKFDCSDGYWYTSPAGTFKPNPYGLYDVLGNVWEWCSDWYDSSYYENSPRNNPQGPSSGSGRVFRGGSCYGAPARARASNRYWDGPASRSGNLGFRLASP